MSRPDERSFLFVLIVSAIFIAVAFWLLVHIGAVKP